jgi:osmotically-inducible protein OsmY
MRDVATERSIERRMATRFDIDTSRVDVTVIDREATITGVLMNRTKQQPLTDLQEKEFKRFFSASRLEGVDRVYFNLKQASLGY